MADYSAFAQLSFDGKWTEACLTPYHHSALDGKLEYNPHKWGGAISDFDVAKFMKENPSVKALCFVGLGSYFSEWFPATFIERGQRAMTDKDLLFVMFKVHIAASGHLSEQSITSHLKDVYTSISFKWEWNKETNEDILVLSEPIPNHLVGDGNWDYSM